ncbi:hypothetical protein Cylst_3430 [Cylindrospermum stagnale PCC 7417]|uniref:Uncharacterized protein n=1 Tax=Cylindrospermum stagnale PCC 7417 TaxID=56107 RepID=K9WZ05_9NOST|nr:hypothetical protein Cylst_3430 [Cylindrospermum stagnale PCC 7417]
MNLYDEVVEQLKQNRASIVFATARLTKSGYGN